MAETPEQRKRAMKLLAQQQAKKSGQRNQQKPAKGAVGKIVRKIRKAYGED